MPYGMYLSAEGAQAQAARMEVIANNLANVNTPGFKPDVTIFGARFAEAIEQGQVAPESGQREDIGGGIEVLGTLTDFAPGTLQVTGKDTDLAVDGDGFFQVRKDDQNFLTRAGNFRINGNGELVTPGGHHVLSDAGLPVLIDPDSPWQVTPDGAVLQNGRKTFLALMQPGSLGDLVKAGENLFSALAPVEPVAPTERRIVSGALEGSGVNPTSTMVELIETSRAMQANMQLIQNQDNVTESLIGRLLFS